MSDDKEWQRICDSYAAENQRFSDRIKKLEAALAHIYAWYPISVAGPLQTIHEIRDFARKELEENDD